MNIGFDAKRAYHNETGLGNYSRTLVTDLSTLYPEHQYFLFNPKPSKKYALHGDNIHEVLPQKKLHQIFNFIWRSHWIKSDIIKKNIDLFHGLSHEIPTGLKKAGIKSVVTIHDLIFLRYPEQYNPIDIKIYTAKFKYACKHADHIITVSQQTKDDVIHYFGTDSNKITVCHISCDRSYQSTVSEPEKLRVKKMLNLPDEYMLYVGSIIERKNLLGICKAMAMIKNEIHLPLVVIGRGKKYKEDVKKLALENGISDRLIFLSEKENQSQEYISGSCFPAIYQNAKLFLYPSVFEGFGIPVLEALFCKTPVITSNISSLPEVGGNAAYYVNPENPSEIAEGIKKIINDEVFADKMRADGLLQASNFTPDKCAASVMEVYKKIV
jgi:glycosyltransferase involved in cell wall biosynthesis